MRPSYLLGTATMKLHVKENTQDTLVLSGYTDADFAARDSDRKSISAAAIPQWPVDPLVLHQASQRLPLYYGIRVHSCRAWGSRTTRLPQVATGNRRLHRATDPSLHGQLGRYRANYIGGLKSTKQTH